jgi:hypothetical protein
MTVTLAWIIGAPRGERAEGSTSSADGISSECFCIQANSRNWKC